MLTSVQVLHEKRNFSAVFIYRVTLSLTCTRTSIPASWQACSHCATSSGSPLKRTTLLLYSITADMCCRRDVPQNPHGRPDARYAAQLHRQVFGRSAFCGGTDNRDQRRYDNFRVRCSARRRFCSASRRGCAMARPASVSSTASCRFRARRVRSQPASSDDGRRRAGLAVDRGFPANSCPFYVPRQHVARPFFSSRAASTISTLRCSGDGPAALSHYPVTIGQMRFLRRWKSASMSSCLFMAFIEE